MERTSYKQVDMTKEARDLEAVLAKIVNHRKANLKGLFRQIVDNSENPDLGFPVEVIHDSIDITFAETLSQNEKYILKAALETDTSRAIEPKDLLERVKKSVKDEGDRIQMHFYLRAFILDRLRVSTEDYFYDFGVYKKRDYPQLDFVNAAVESLKLTREEAVFAFQVLADRAQSVVADDVFECVQCFRRLNPASRCGPAPASYPPNRPTTLFGKFQEPTEGEMSAGNPSKVISDSNADSIRTVKEELRKKKLSALHVFRVADPHQKGNVSVITLRNAFQELLPSLKPQALFSLMKIIDRNRNGFIDLSEYEIVMLDDKADLEAIKDNDSRLENNRSEKGSSLQGSRLSESVKSSRGSARGSVKSQTGLGGAPGDQLCRDGVLQDSEDPADLCKAIGVYLVDTGSQVEELFRFVDDKSTGVAPTHSVWKLLKENLPKSDKSVLLKAARYLDSNRCGFVTKGDFTAGLSNGPLSLKAATPKEEKRLEAGAKKVLVAKSAETALPPIDDGTFYNQVRILRFQLHQKNIDSNILFADQEAPVLTLAQEVSKKLPEFPKQKIVQILRYLDSTSSGVVSQQDFDLMIGFAPAGEGLDDTRYFDEACLDRKAIDKLAALLKKKAMTPARLFEESDSDRNGEANILDMKKAIETRFKGEENAEGIAVEFVRDLKYAFKTYDFDAKRFELFMKSPEAAFNFESRLMSPRIPPVESEAPIGCQRPDGSEGSARSPGQIRAGGAVEHIAVPRVHRWSRHRQQGTLHVGGVFEVPQKHEGLSDIGLSLSLRSL